MHPKIVTILLVSLSIVSCGQPKSISDNQKIEDNQVVVVKEGQTIGVFKLLNQIGNPETSNYEWELYEIGDRDEKLIKTGSGLGFAGHEPWGFLSVYNDVPIRFGPFKYRWSINQTGRGWVYFKAPADGREQSYCITNGYPKYSIKELITGCSFNVIKNE